MDSIFGTPLGPLLGHDQRSIAVSGMGAATFDPAVQNSQKLMNGVLRPLGFQTIGVDGKLGPQTCGAALYLADETPKPESDAVKPAWDALWADLDARPTFVSGCAASYGRGVPYWPKRIAYPVLPQVPPPTTGLPAGVSGAAWVSAVQRLQIALNYALSELGYGIKDKDGDISAVVEDGSVDVALCGAVDFVWKAIKAGTPLRSAAQLTAALHAPIGSTTVSDILYPMCAASQPWAVMSKEVPPSQDAQPGAPPSAVATGPGTSSAARASVSPWLVGGAVGAALLAGFFLLKR